MSFAVASGIPDASFRNSTRTPCVKKKKKESWVPGVLVSEYQKEYWEKAAPFQRTEPIRPRSAELRDPRAIFEDNTSYVDNFKAWPANPSKSMKPAQAPPSPQDFSPYTTYHAEFPLKVSPYVRVRPVHTATVAPGIFESETSNSRDYPSWGPPVRRPPTTRAASVPRGDGVFYGQPTYRSDYAKWDVQRPVVARGPQVPYQSSGKFEDATSYSQTFTPKDSVPVQIVKPYGGALEPTTWYGGLPSSEYGTQFFQKGVRPSTPARPGSTSGPMPKGPFDSGTTYGSTFRPLLAPHRPAVSTKPVAALEEPRPFFADTTYRSSFIPKDVPYARVKPTNAWSPPPGKLSDETTNLATFKPWGTVPMRSGTDSYRRASLGQGNQPFEGHSTYKKDFLRPDTPLLRDIQGQPTAGCGRPAGGGTSVLKGDFEDQTTYKAAYYEKAISYQPPFLPNDGTSYDEGDT